MTPRSTPVRSPRAFGLRIEPDALAPLDRHREAPSLTPVDRLLALAEGLASSPLWRAIPEAILVVRPDPPAGLALLGCFSAAEVARLEALSAQVELDLPRLRYVDYRQAELDCEALAAKLIERFGRESLLAMRYAAIPRGGHIVLGMLSYALGLRPENLTPPDGPHRALVVVDDCALSGLRFAQHMAASDERPVVFAHLYSHPDLRAAIEVRERRVIGAVAARDLTDHAPEVMGEGYEEWRDRWRGRAGGVGYWVGRPERICFAWSEPTLSFWNPVTGREEEGWRMVPPRACLRNRDGADDSAARVQLQPPAIGSLRAADHTFYGELNGDVIVARLDRGQAIRLADLAGDIWREVVRHGELEPAVNALGRAYDAPLERIRADAEAMVVELHRRGLLARQGTGDDAAA